MTKFNLAALAAISIAFTMVPLALAHDTGSPHREGNVKKTAATFSGAKPKKIASKNRKAQKVKGMSQKMKMDPNMKM